MDTPAHTPLLSAKTDEDFVENCFQLFLGRTGDEAGSSHHLNELSRGGSRMNVIEAFIKCDEFQGLKRVKNWVPAGHFYSPMPSVDEVAAHKQSHKIPDNLPAIDLQEKQQKKIMTAFAELYESIPFEDEAVAGLRYKYVNSSYPPGDSIPLHCMLRHLKPKRFIEVGSGNSSCVTLDTVEKFLDNETELTFIEPYPEFFKSLVKKEDIERVTLIPTGLQQVPHKVFEALEAGDVLFIDSTHVSKLDSDVNHFLFEIFPRLKPGVFIHIHDVFYPFEYPQTWLEEGRGWNEQYVLRAFLQFNQSFEIRFFNSFLYRKHKSWFKKNMPKCLEAQGGSIWLEKVSN